MCGGLRCCGWQLFQWSDRCRRFRFFFSSLFVWSTNSILMVWSWWFGYLGSSLWKGLLLRVFFRFFHPKPSIQTTNLRLVDFDCRLVFSVFLFFLRGGFLLSSRRDAKMCQGYYASNSRLDGIHHWGTGRWKGCFRRRRHGESTQVWTQNGSYNGKLAHLGCRLIFFFWFFVCSGTSLLWPFADLRRCLLIAPCTTDRSILQSTSASQGLWSEGKIYFLLSQICTGE